MDDVKHAYWIHKQISNESAISGYFFLENAHVPIVVKK